MLAAYRIHITGIVQGVGFRPFVYNLATNMGLAGWVLNSSAGVEIEATGTSDTLDSFVQSLRSEAPPLAHIDRLSIDELPEAKISSLQGNGFTIKRSRARPGEFQPISPDVAICADCLRELFDPTDRRFRYPFINCTNCGPRFTIIQDIPYDRPKTTMAPFKMCPDCQHEYENPTNRRFHAQPNACPVCGPRVWFQRDRHSAQHQREVAGDNAVQATRQALANGDIVAIKGLGGFHLACDATNNTAVARLRERKGRVDKAFALMSFDASTVEKYCELDPSERKLLTSRERPIVLLRRRASTPVSPLVAPRNNTLGVMLPYTPLHYLLLHPDQGNPPFPLALVMTCRIEARIYAADRGYDDGENHYLLEYLGLKSAIKLNDYRTKKKDKNKQIWIDLSASPEYEAGQQERYKVERKYGEAKVYHGLRRCRYVGRLRYAIQAYLTAIALNLKRMVKLLTGTNFKGRAWVGA